MNKQLLTLGIVLSLGTVGCAGLGFQHGSSLTAQLENEQGLDELWRSAEQAPTQGLETAHYAEQGLGGLWHGDADGPDGVRDDGSAQKRHQGDLWNPASVARSWEVHEGSEPTRSSGLLFGAWSGRGIWH